MISFFTTVAVLLVSVIAYDYLVAFFDFSSIPVIAPTWTDLVSKHGKTIRTLCVEAYEKYSKNGKPFRLARHEYVLPPDLLEQSRKLPTNVLSSHAANDTTLAFSPTLGHDFWDTVNFTRQYVTRSMQYLIPSVEDEIKYAYKTYFGAATDERVTKDGKEYTSVTLHPTLLTMIGIIGAKVMFGRKYSRDKTFTDLAGRFANTVGIQAILLGRVCPSLLRPFVRNYVIPYLENARISARIRAMLRPDILRYIEMDEEELDRQTSEAGIDFSVLPMLVKYVQKAPGYENATADQVLKGVSGRILALLFAAVDTTTITSTQIIFDLIGHPKEQYADPILAQVKSAYESNGRVWNMTSLGALPLLDSFIKESQRLHPIGVSLGNRVVMPKGGYTFMPNGAATQPTHFKQGDMIVTPLAGVHFDPNHYSSPYDFQGFRFVNEKVVSSQPSDIFMSFGHGRHACPGRHLALNILKLIIIEFLRNYDWLEKDKRPEDFMFGSAMLPQMKEKIQIRRKEVVDL